MSLKETIFSMMIEALELSEAVEVRHDRYMRSHGKKARDSGQGSSSWMFTHKPMGDVNYNDKKEVHTAQGKFADAKKSAQQWAKEHGHSSVYVMEEVELDEEGHGVFLKGGSVGEKRSGKPVEVHSNIDDAKAQAKRLNKLLSPGEKQHYGLKYHVKPVTEGFVVELDEEAEQIDEISDAKKKEYIRAVADKGGILRKPRPGSLKGFDIKKDDALVKAFKGGSMQDYANLHKKSEKRAGIALDTLNSLKKEEVELDEGVKEKISGIIRREKQKEYPLLQNRRDVAANKAGSAYADGDHKKGDRYMKWRDDNMKKEEVELDEAKTDIYHKHMLKALGKTRLPKDHGYTSAIANNGDFVVHNAGRVVGRIAKGEHDLK